MRLKRIGRAFEKFRASMVIPLAAAAVAVPDFAWARKFDFKNESVATYFKGTYGPSQVLGTPYAHSSGDSTTAFSETIRNNYSGEFGLVFSTNMFNLRIAGELILPSHISDVKGKNAAGENLFILDTKTSALVPWVYFDAVIFRTPTSKAYVGGGLGYAYVKMENIYAMTDTGAATYPTVGDFVEKADSEAMASTAYVGYEMLFADNSTIVFDLGYRYLAVADLTHLTAGTTFLGDVSRGDRVRKADGHARTLDFSGAYVGLAFRFYIGL